MCAKSSPLPERERVARRLSRAGVASRREAERMIAAGRVSVGGQLCESPATTVTADDSVEVDGRRIPQLPRSRMWCFHKPPGVLTARSDPRGRQLFTDLLPQRLPLVMPVGRLDFNSEGLLLLTNDGALKRFLELPANRKRRVYRARVRGRPTEESLAPLRAGLVLDGERFRPMEVAIERQGTSNAWLRLGLTEGRNREIRRALEHVGLPVNRLIRVAYGDFELGDLPRGGVRECPSSQVKALTEPGERTVTSRRKATKPKPRRRSAKKR